jgi:hypothetical protein
MKIVYVASMAHSGSTLLDLLISAHSQVASVGEVKNLVDVAEPGCSCSATSVWTCPFWGEVGRRFEARTGVELRRAQILRESEPAYGAHNRALFESIAEVTGRTTIVDSSKGLERLRGLVRTAGLDVFPIHLVRRPQGVVYSHLRKGRGWVRLALRHGRRTVETAQFVDALPHLSVAYEDLAASPRETLAGVMSAIGMSFEPDQLHWAGRERHNCEGNRMRRSSDHAIRPDLAWRTALPLWQRQSIGVLASLGRIAARVAPAALPRSESRVSVGEASRVAAA